MPTKLKTYEEAMAGVTMDKPGNIKSGVKSGDIQRRKGKPDKVAELVLVEPLKQHPEIPELYRAIDPDTGWKGWVKYSPPAPPVKPEPVPEPEPEPTPPPAPTAQELKEQAFNEKYKILRDRQRLADLGVIEDSSLDPLRAEVKTLAADAGII